jgi:phosphomannomutase
MKPLKIGISGVRGIVGETLTPELIISFAQAFGTYLDSGLVLVGRDSRPSGPMVRSAVLAGLVASGCEVIDLGLCPTPTLQLAVKGFGARGGISITGGHNPAPWNALKFVRGDGLYLNVTQAEELLDIFHQGEFAKAPWDRIRTTIGHEDPIPHHLDVLTGAFDIDAIRARRLRVAVDCCNGSCSVISPQWLERCGCTVLSVNADVTAPFPHSPEPNRENMAQLSAIVRAGSADIGLAHDADGERIGIVTRDGAALSEERTLVLAVDIALGQKPGPVVTNLSTTMAVESVAARYGVPVVRTPVGQSYISEAMVEHGAVIGGEGNGGVAVPRVHCTHDAMATTGLILEYLARGKRTLSEMLDLLPATVMVKRDFPVKPSVLYSILQQLRDEVEHEETATVDLTDGIKLSWRDGWVHVRASNTESLIRVIAESDTAARAGELVDFARDRLKGM